MAAWLEEVPAFHIDSLFGLLVNPDLFEISRGLAANLSGQRSDVQTGRSLSLEIFLQFLVFILNTQNL